MTDTPDTKVTDSQESTQAQKSTDNTQPVVGKEGATTNEVDVDAVAAVAALLFQTQADKKDAEAVASAKAEEDKKKADADLVAQGAEKGIAKYLDLQAKSKAKETAKAKDTKVEDKDTKSESKDKPEAKQDFKGIDTKDKFKKALEDAGESKEVIDKALAYMNDTKDTDFEGQLKEEGNVVLNIIRNELKTSSTNQTDAGVKDSSSADNALTDDLLKDLIAQDPARNVTDIPIGSIQMDSKVKNVLKGLVAHYEDELEIDGAKATPDAIVRKVESHIKRVNSNGSSILFVESQDGKVVTMSRDPQKINMEDFAADDPKVRNAAGQIDNLSSKGREHLQKAKDAFIYEAVTNTAYHSLSRNQVQQAMGDKV